MAVLVKCDPASINANGDIDAELPIYKECAPNGNELAYVWLSETQGGSGLHAIGNVRLVEWLSKRELRIVVDISASPRLSRSMGIDDLRPYRSDPTKTIGSLAGKLLKHSLNKVASLDGDEQQLLKTYFVSG